MCEWKAPISLLDFDDALEAVIDLGALALRFGRVDRLTRHEDGMRLESDSDHTVMLGLVACSLASEFTTLDVGKVAALALVHDIPEAYAGDTPTLRITPGQRVDKQEREEAAIDRLWGEFGESLYWVPRTIAAYERRKFFSEARFVYAVDKLLPKITHLLNGGAVLKAEGEDYQSMHEIYKRQADSLSPYFHEFPILGELYRGLYAKVLGLEGL